MAPPAFGAALERLLAPSAVGGTVGFYERARCGFRTESTTSFVRRAGDAARGLIHQGLDVGRPVLVVASRPEEMWLGFLAAILAGAVPAIHAHRPGFAEGDQARIRLDAALATLGPGAGTIVATAEDERSATGRTFTLDRPSLGPDDLGRRLAAAAPEDPLYVQFTSGSTTAAGRATLISHGALSANVEAFRRTAHITDRDVFVTWLPLYHDFGLVGAALTSLVMGADLHLLSPFDFLRDPSAWLGGITDLGGTVSVSPNFGFDHAARRLADHDLSRFDLSTWRAAMCGGEPIDAATMRRFAATFAPCGFRPEAFTPGYGLAEGTCLLAGGPPGEVPQRLVVTQESVTRLARIEIVDSGPVTDEPPADPELAEVVSVRWPCFSHLQVVDGDGRPVEEDHCGEIIAGGPSVALGYLRPEGGLEPFDPGRLPTGDIGFFHDGQLYVIERLKNVIIRHGHNHSCRALEELVAEVGRLAAPQVTVVDSDLRAGRGRVTAIVELDAGAPPRALADRLCHALEHFEPPVEELVVVRSGTVPRTTSGKKRHAEVRARLAAGTLKVVARFELCSTEPGDTGLLRDAGADDTIIDLEELATEDVILSVVGRLAEERGSLDRLTPSAHLAHDLQLDSLDLFELAVELEEALGIALDDEQLGAATTVSDLTRISTALRRRRGTPELTLTETLERFSRLPSLHVVVEEQQGRRVRVGNRWLVDFASCNYLGLDLDADVMASVAPAIERWGTHPSWTRAIASPAPYRDLEAALARLVGAPDTVVFPTVTLLHFGVLPKLAGPHGTILLDAAAHRSLQEAAGLARSRGTGVRTWRHQDLGDLERLLDADRSRGPRIIVVDGVYSMSGDCPDLVALLALARRYDALVYVDDAHGFGVLGAGPTTARRYGSGGAGVAAHQGVVSDRLVYVGGMSKAFSSLGAFVTCSARTPRQVLESASTLVFSGPIPVASLATALAGLVANEQRGDARRDRLARLTTRLSDGLDDLGFELLPNAHGFPIVTAVLGRPAAVHDACLSLWDDGVLLTPSFFPAAPLHRGGVRFTLTAANDEHQVDQVLRAMDRLERTSPGVVEQDVARAS